MRALFQKYNKYKNSLAVIDEQLIKTREEINYIENLLLSHASLSDIDEIRDELIQQGYLRDRNRKAKKRRKRQADVACLYFIRRHRALCWKTTSKTNT